MNLDEFELDAEVKEKILALHEADVTGLKAKNSELIEREKGAKSSLEQYQLEQTQAAEDAKVALAEKEGDIEKYKAAVQERDDAMNALKHDILERDNKIVMDGALAEFSNKLSDDPAARSYMQQKFRESVDIVDGQLKPKDVTKDINALTESILNDPAHKAYVKANVGSGAGSAGSTGAGSAFTGSGNFNGNKQDKVKAAVAANPKLASLPVK